MKQKNAKQKNEIKYKQKHIQEQINDNMEANKHCPGMMNIHSQHLMHVIAEYCT